MTPDSELNPISQLLGITCTNDKNVKIAFIHKGDSLIYLALSKSTGESV